MTFGLREWEREMANSISIFRERESKWKIPIQFSGTGTGMKIPYNSIPIFGNGNGSEKFHSRLSGQELEAGIPGNSRDRELPLMVDFYEPVDGSGQHVLSCCSSRGTPCCWPHTCTASPRRRNRSC